RCPLMEIEELSSWTFCTFPRELSPFRRQGTATWQRPFDPRHGSAFALVRRAVPSSSRLRLQTHAPVGTPGSERRSAHRGHAAASTDGHVSHLAARFASRRVRRAAAARALRSAGTVPPVPKYFSAGVCPRNVECGSTRLCSST